MPLNCVNYIYSLELIHTVSSFDEHRLRCLKYSDCQGGVCCSLSSKCKLILLIRRCLNFTMRVWGIGGEKIVDKQLFR